MNARKELAWIRTSIRDLQQAVLLYITMPVASKLQLADLKAEIVLLMKPDTARFYSVVRTAFGSGSLRKARKKYREKNRADRAAMVSAFNAGCLDLIRSLEELYLTTRKPWPGAPTKIVRAQRPRRAAASTEWKATLRKARWFARYSAACSREDGGVSTGYVLECLDKADVVLLIQREDLKTQDSGTSPSRGIGGLLAARLLPDTRGVVTRGTPHSKRPTIAYIDIVCSRPGVSARPLIDAMLTYGREKGSRYASLHAVNTVLGYYPRFGFRRDPDKHDSDASGYRHTKNLSKRKNWFPAANVPNSWKNRSIVTKKSPVRASSVNSTNSANSAATTYARQ